MTTADWRRLSIWGAIVALALPCLGIAGFLVLGSSGLDVLCGRDVQGTLQEAPQMVRTGGLIGLDKTQLESLLGPASQKTFQSWDTAYYLGPDDACVDSRWLVLRFGAEGRVIESAVAND